MYHPHDTIVALSSARGGAARAVVRLSGKAAFPLTATLCPDVQPVAERSVRALDLRLDGVHSPLPADVYLWPAPRTYTGEDLVEIHTLGSPPLVELLIAQLLKAGARAAEPGEFTLRAFLAGKLDLPRAEGVLGVIEANDAEELKQALTQLAGGLTQPLVGLREDLLNMLADVEAALDFSEEDIQFVDQKEALLRLGKAMAQVTHVRRQLEGRAVAERPFRAVLVGAPNVGKSSLFNALAGESAALTSSTPGTTRDYLVRRLDLEGTIVELVDTAGWQSEEGQIIESAQRFGDEQSRQADLVLVCFPKGEAPPQADSNQLLVVTKDDDGTTTGGLLASSARTGRGLEELRATLRQRAKERRQSALAPSLSRCRHHVETCLGHLRQAHHIVLFEEPAEILALELRGALDQLGEMVGAVYSEDLLDRIFSRFCIGK